MLKGMALLLLAAAGVATASEHLTAPIGWLSRGGKMLGAGNYTGAVDQLSQLQRMNAPAPLMEEAQFMMAMSLYGSGSVEALPALNGFLAMYPTSVHRSTVLCTIGDRYFYSGKYGEAIATYDQISPATLDGAALYDMHYRRGYAKLRLGEYESARADFDYAAQSSRYRQAGAFYDAYVDYATGDYAKAANGFAAIKGDSPLTDAAQFYLTQIAFHRGDHATTLEHALPLLGKPTTYDMHHELMRLAGESYFATGDEARAEDYLTRYANLSTEEFPTQRSAAYLLGVIAERQGNTQQVVERMSEVLASDTDDALAQSANLYLGQAYVKQGNYDQATLAFEKAMSTDFDSSVRETAFFNYAVAQSKASRTPFSRAIDYFEEFLNLYPNSRYQSQVENYLTQAYINGNDYEKALNSISHIKKPSDNVLKAKQYVLYNLGINATRNGALSTARQHLTEAIGLGDFGNGILAQSNLWLGDLQYKAGSYTAAAKSYDSYLKNSASTDDNRSLGWYDLGYAQFKNRRWSDARTAFANALKGTQLGQQQRADAYNRIGDTYYYSKDFADANANYAKATTEDASTADYATYQAAIIDGLQKNQSGKVDKLNTLLKDYPNSRLVPAALLQKGQALTQLGRHSEAATALQQLTERFPEAPETRKALLLLAMSQRSQGQLDKAVANYRKVVTKYPSSEEAQLAVEDLKVISAERGDMESLQKFLASVPNAPKISVSEMDKLTFETAEKAWLSATPDVSKVNDYLAKYPDGAYANNAIFYQAQYNYSKGNYDAALSQLNKVLDRAPSASYAEDALALKADILLRKNRNDEALAAYQQLAKRASTATYRTEAALGTMRAAAQLGRNAEVIAAADKLIATGGLSSDQLAEARFLRASALAATGKSDRAVTDWQQLAKDTRTLYGARSAYSLAEHYYNSGNLAKAEQTLNSFIEAGTPHQYWLARGFILLSDIYQKQGKTLAAIQYLESLKSNYPGKEADIFKMIESRLNNLKNANK